MVDSIMGKLTKMSIPSSDVNNEAYRTRRKSIKYRKGSAFLKRRKFLQHILIPRSKFYNYI